MSPLDALAKGRDYLFTAPLPELLGKVVKGARMLVAAAEAVDGVNNPIDSDKPRAPQPPKREDDQPMAPGAYGDETGERGFYDKDVGDARSRRRRYDDGEEAAR